MVAVKNLLLQSLLVPGFPASLKYVQSHCATIFMLHRFRDDARGIHGCEESNLRRGLDYLRRNGYEFISLVDLFERLAGSGRLPKGAVAFTIDDGYIDQAKIAAPIFAEYRCPVTTFVSTGFLDRKLWFWWDKIEHAFLHASRTSIAVQLGMRRLDYRWENDGQRSACQLDFTENCKLVPDAQKHAAIAMLADAAGVTIPVEPPPHCEPMSWDDLRQCEQAGMSFGPHTVTHPVLSRTTDETSREEIAGSWARLREEAANPVPIFCYPNGGWPDFGEREVTELQRQGFAGAVVGEPGYADAKLFRKDPANAFRVQRFGFPDELPYLIQYASGVERFKQILRRSA